MFGYEKGNSVLLLPFILLQVVVFSYSKPSHVWLENGYRDVVVSLPEDSPVESRGIIIRSVQDLFRQASPILYVATKRRATFSKVIILIPSSWSVPEELLSQENTTTGVLESNGGFPSFLDADIVISQKLGNRKRPYVLQDDGCGKSGLRINMPVEFLLSNQNITSKGIEFIHYWSQYRYGVFTEGGFLNDSRYPQYYSVPGTTKIEITDCSNTPLTSRFTMISGDGFCEPHVENQTGKPIFEECKQTPIFGNKTKLQSSIMYQQALPHTFRFCEGDHSIESRHNPNSPSKHNILCSQDATWPVILRNPDFAFGKNLARRYKPEKVSFQFVKESNVRVIIAIDVSSHIAENGRYGLIQNAIRNFVLQDLSLGAEFGLVFFDEYVKTFRKMTSLPSESAKRAFFESSSFYDDLETSSNITCLECGIEFSLHLLRNSSKKSQNGIVVFISTNGSLTEASGTNLQENLKFDGTRLFGLLFADGKSDNYEPLESLISASKGSLTQVPEERQVQTLSHLYLSFHRILSGMTSSADEDNILFVKEISATATDIVWNFYVDAMVTQDLTLLISGPDYNIMQPVLNIDRTNLTAPSGTLAKHYREFFIPAWSYKFSSAETGNYTFYVKKKVNVLGDCFIIVSGKPASNITSITLTIWTNHYSPKVTEPLKLFAEVKYGRHPIINVTVKATIRDPSGAIVSLLELLDNGLGDPDITKNDGIYTRYCDIFKYSLAGYYTATIDAFGDESEILYISNDDCCGSFVPSYKKKVTGPFNRTTGPLTFRLSRNQSLNNLTLPNRIFDLRIYKIREDQGTVLLHWTAAGAHLDHGAASTYRLKLFDDRINAKRRFEETGLDLKYNKEIIQFTPSKDYGNNLMEYTVQWPETLRPGFYYFAVKAVDVSGRSSDISNVVEAFLENKFFNDSISCDYFPEPDAAVSVFCKKPFILTICLILRLIINCSFNV